MLKKINEFIEPKQKSLQPVESFSMCELTENAPYYDCSVQWQINIFTNDLYGLIPCPYAHQGGLSGCANCIHHKIDIFMSGLSGEKDYCGRTIFHHELIHMKYKNLESHYTCNMW